MFSLLILIDEKPYLLIICVFFFFFNGFKILTVIGNENITFNNAIEYLIK